MKLFQSHYCFQKGTGWFKHLTDDKGRLCWKYCVYQSVLYIRSCKKDTTQLNIFFLCLIVCVYVMKSYTDRFQLWSPKVIRFLEILCVKLLHTVALWTEISKRKKRKEKTVKKKLMGEFVPNAPVNYRLLSVIYLWAWLGCSSTHRVPECQ